MGGRLSASPAPHGYLLRARPAVVWERTCSPAGGWQQSREVARVRALFPRPASRSEAAALRVQSVLGRDPAALDTAAPPPLQAGHPEAGISGSRRSWHRLQPPALGPASSLKLMQRFLFGAGDARAPPPPLFL